MDINIQSIEKLADLAKLNFETEAQKNAIAKDLQQILTLIEQINRIDTHHIEPLVHLTQQSVWHNDQHETPTPVGEVLKNAPQHNESFVWVPKVIQK